MQEKFIFMKKYINSIVAIILFSVVLTGCTNIEEDSSNKLVIYSGRSESLVGPIIERFRQETGIDAEVRYGSSSEMALTILEEGEKSPADIFFAQDPGALGLISDANMLAKLSAKITDKIDQRFVSPDSNWVGISGRVRVIVFNTEFLTTEDLPTDLWGFTEPKWRGKIGLPPTNGSFQTMITGLRSVWGEEKTEEWLTAILANEPTYYEKNTPTVAAVAAGEVQVGFVNHYYLYRFIAEEGVAFAARNYFLSAGGPGSLVMVSGAGILNTSKNTANATTFLHYLLSEEAQQYFADETYEYPMIDNISIHEELVPLSELNAQEINLSNLSDIEGTIKMLREVGYLPN
jgi:iron(III) transport system substrate-binding protein